jgi:cell division protein FtsB
MLANVVVFPHPVNLVSDLARSAAGVSSGFQPDQAPKPGKIPVPGGYHYFFVASPEFFKENGASANRGRSQVASTAAPEETGRAKFRPKVAVAASLALGLVLVLLVFFSHRGLFQIYHLKQEKARLNQENARLAEENARLARTVDRLHHDPEMIQDLIRREMNFVKKNEIIIQLPPGAHDRPVQAAILPDRPPPAAQGGMAASRPRGQTSKAPGSRPKTP